MEEELVEIRCPLKIMYTSKITGKDKERICDRCCIKVFPGSRGEAWCPVCKKAFDFEVSDQSYAGGYMPNLKENVE